MDTGRYAELFLTESREHLSAINNALLQLERAAESPSGDAASDGQRAAVADLFRAVHTVKGMSATMGYTAVASLSHEMEAVMDRVRRGELAVGGPLMDALFKAADGLEKAIEDAVAGTAADPRVERLAQRIRGLAQASGPEGDTGRRTAPRRGPKAVGNSGGKPPGSRPSGGKAGNGGSRVDGPGVRVRIAFNPDALLRGVRAAMAIQRARGLGEVADVTPSESTFGTDEFGYQLEFWLATSTPLPQVETVLRSVEDVAAVEIDGQCFARDGAKGRHTRRTVTIPASPEKGNGASPDGAPRARAVRIDHRRLDALMNLIGELVIARGRLVELTTSLGGMALTETVGHAARLIGELQDEIMTCRMVPVWQVFDRFPRLVRDAARALGKRVAFDVEGKDIELDRSMLDEIGDPIVHLLRNAVDHGIEAPGDRTLVGKPAEGRLTLSAVRDRSAVLIRVSDDGRGIDRDKVLARARETGLVDPATTSLTDEEVVRLIARPGFTTADRVTDLSGRGVGVDAVQTRVRSLGGSVEIKSTPGVGTTATVRLPLTLAIMRALLARVGGETYAFPMAHVDETVAAEGAALAAVRGRAVMVLRGDAMPYVRLRELVGTTGESDPAGPTGDPEHHVLVIESAGRRAAVAVDELTGQQDIVVKQFDGVRGGLSLFSGATILGDGAPALIVDVSSLF